MNTLHGETRFIRDQSRHVSAYKSSGFVSANTVLVNFQFTLGGYLRLPVPVMTTCSRYVMITSRKTNKTEVCYIVVTTLPLAVSGSGTCLT